MIEKGFQILVGDANGADKAIQRYLADKSYPNVLVHCMKDHCRNNVGNWPTREVSAPRGAKGFDYYSLKDRAVPLLLPSQSMSPYSAAFAISRSLRE